MNVIPDEREGQPSASSFARLTACPGSYQLTLKARELGLAAEHESPAAARGTRIHKWLEDPTAIVLEQEEAEAALILKEKADIQVEILFPGGKYTDLREERLWFGPKRAKLRLSARFDRVVYDADTALCINFKTGWAEQGAPESNAQLKVEALLVAIHLPKTITRFIAQIVTVPHGVSQAEYSVADMRALYEEITDDLVALEDPNAPLRPSPAACKYCPAITICQAVKDTVQPVIRRFSDLPDGGPDAAQLLDECEVLERHIAEVRSTYAERSLANPGYIPNYGIVPGNEVREIKDFAQAVTRLTPFVAEEQINATRKYTMGALEKLYGQATGLKAKAGKDAFNKLMEGIIEVKTNKGSLKRIRGEALVSAFEPPKQLEAVNGN